MQATGSLPGVLNKLSQKSLISLHKPLINSTQHVCSQSLKTQENCTCSSVQSEHITRTTSGTSSTLETKQYLLPSISNTTTTLLDVSDTSLKSKRQKFSAALASANNKSTQEKNSTNVVYDANAFVPIWLSTGSSILVNSKQHSAPIWRRQSLIRQHLYENWLVMDLSLLDQEDVTLLDYTVTFIDETPHCKKCMTEIKLDEYCDANWWKCQHKCFEFMDPHQTWSKYFEYD